MIGYDSYQDPRLEPRESWFDDMPSQESFIDDLVEKYRPAAVAELEALVAAGETDGYEEEHIRDFALAIAEENGETPETALRDWQSDYVAAYYAH